MADLAINKADENPLKANKPKPNTGMPCTFSGNGRVGFPRIDLFGNSANGINEGWRKLITKSN
jgi:hypothetical protein